MFLRFIFLFVVSTAHAVDYHVGPNQPLNSISEAPWANLMPGDRVFIHWRSTPYKEKWVINRQGTEQQRIEIIGVSGPKGQQPIIDGDGAITVAGVNYWNEARGVIKIGGSNTPADGLPRFITVENLHIKSARPAYSFINDNGNNETYSNNAASIYIEKGANIIIRNCTLSDSGNGLFLGAFDGQSKDLLFEKNHFYDNGIVGRIFEHNSYTAGINVTYQYNRFGPLRQGAGGNNLKDRSAGLIVKYNWIESGNRQLDLVDAEDSSNVVNDPAYNNTYVYGNILIEPDGAGNSQMVHYGGDSGITEDYRKGNLYFYNNTLISTRTGNTTLLRLSTNDETAHVFNNIYYGTAAGNRLALIDGSGVLNLNNNWLKQNWVDCHCSVDGIINNNGANIVGTEPLFINLNAQDFNLQNQSPAINQGTDIPSNLLPEHALNLQYLPHQAAQSRPLLDNPDIGAFEFCGNDLCDTIFTDGFDF